jgi:hypothetical protein
MVNKYKKVWKMISYKLLSRKQTHSKICFWWDFVLVERREEIV